MDSATAFKSINFGSAKLRVVCVVLKSWCVAQDIVIFRVEGTGALQTQEVVSMALEWLMAKMRNLKDALASSGAEDDNEPIEM